MTFPAPATIALAWLLLSHSLTRAATPLPLENFETESSHVQFSPGAEFPGATGRFERSAKAAREGAWGGRLHFDFSGGGRYVALLFQPTQTPDPSLPVANALAVWVRCPPGHELALRYTDTANQTFQKPIETSPEEWSRIVVPFDAWTAHWGGANDGQVRGGPTRLALLVELGESPAGHVDFDDLQLVRHADPTVQTTLAAYRFAPDEGWSLRPHGPSGASQLDGRILRLDFRQGAQSFSLVPPDRSLPGNVDQLKLRVFGSVRQLPVRLHLRTHFMTFHRAFGSLDGDGHLELATDGPPGPAWEWFGGQNDGKLHGPLRVGEIRFERPASQGIVELELEELILHASSPASKRCLAAAATTDDPHNPEFEFAVRALTETPIQSVAHWELRNWEGDSLAQGQQPLELAPRAAPVQFSIPVPRDARDRFKFIEAEFRLDAPGQVLAPVHTAWVAPLDQDGDTTLRPESPFGMGLYLYRYPQSRAGFTDMERAAAVARAAGVKWSREEFQWARIEPRQGDFQWDFYDRMVETAKRHGIQVYAIVAYWSGWTKPYTAEGIDDYVRYLEALVRRYRADIRHWEIWNEPNIFFWQGPKDLYADLLRKSYTAIKTIDPDAEVLGLSTAGIDFPYIERMLELEAPFDILTIHPYRRALNDRAFLHDLERVSDLVRRPDGTRRPVWLTELGWPTYSPHNTLRQSFAPTTLRAQAELIVRCYLLAIGSGIEPRTFWYNFRNDGEDPFYFEHQMGIVHRNFQPKPAFRTYATLTRILDGLTLEQELNLGSNTLAWSFSHPSQPDRRVLALWNPFRDTTLELPVPVQRIQRVNAVGEAAWLEAKNGRIQVQLRRGAPLYLASDIRRVDNPPDPTTHPTLHQPRRGKSAAPLAHFSPERNPAGRSIGRAPIPHP
jgi:hypothetical protein